MRKIRKIGLAEDVKTSEKERVALEENTKRGISWSEEVKDNAGKTLLHRKNTIQRMFLHQYRKCIIEAISSPDVETFEAIKSNIPEKHWEYLDNKQIDFLDKHYESFRKAMSLLDVKDLEKIKGEDSKNYLQGLFLVAIEKIIGFLGVFAMGGESSKIIECERGILRFFLQNNEEMIREIISQYKNINTKEFLERQVVLYATTKYYRKA